MSRSTRTMPASHYRMARSSRPARSRWTRTRTARSRPNAPSSVARRTSASSARQNRPRVRGDRDLPDPREQPPPGKGDGRGLCRPPASRRDDRPATCDRLQAHRQGGHKLEASWTLKATNPSHGALRHVVVLRDLPGSPIYHSATPGHRLHAGRLCWTLPTLRAGGSGLQHRHPKPAKPPAPAQPSASIGEPPSAAPPRQHPQRTQPAEIATTAAVREASAESMWPTLPQRR